MGRRFKDLTGKRFGKLTVVSFDHKGNGTRNYWKCKCDCGGERVVSGDHLNRGDTTDCGCDRRHTSHWHKHLMWNTRIYRIWSLMKRRCINPTPQERSAYADRGITVCDEWLDSKPFIEWALSHGYSDDLTLDRIDNNKGYYPENCRWVSRAEQSINKRNNHIITYKGESKTITQWARENGLTYCQLWKRIKLGWPFEKAISEPIQTKYSNKKE